ncbi:hypothetical protein RHSIM_Rhsim09G0091700 [Rhododendron simsii]|uniref:Protein kinase domain-containing protein n=1 Tax=Rhododendron simsii TaxID=118357 RepID=A0A834GF92_RHOSS|nr:hypothetical protein RHSIM_Rhsim09G0091700 [Rhododendron simsii]
MLDFKIGHFGLFPSLKVEESPWRLRGKTKNRDLFFFCCCFPCLLNDNPDKSFPRQQHSSAKMVSQFRHLFIPIISLLFFIFPPAEPDLAADRAALINLYSAIGGRACRWNVSDLSPCSWKGVSCNNNDTAVIQLRLPGCGLSGQIPTDSIGSLTNLQNLSLRRNSLSGPLPPDLSSCTQLQRLFLQENKFSGQIPATLFALTNLVRLNLAGNNFSGEISQGFNNLSMLRILELENNNLTGSIPELNNLSRFRKFNVSYNHLNGSIPSGLSKLSNDSFWGNTLCGSPLTACPGNNDGNGGGGGKKLSTGAIIGIVVGSVIGLILILLVLFFLLRKRSPPTATPQAKTSLPRPSGKPAVLDIQLNSPKPLIVREASGDGGSRNGDTVVVNGVQSGRGDGLVFFGEGRAAFALEELLRAPAEVLGKGTSGSTYKAYLEGETQVEVVVVVKRLRDVCVSEREFREKVEDLGMLAHENLVPFRAYYCGREEKLIVFDCMPMGSLSALLHEEYRAALTWEIRTKIALGAAHGIEYLHSLGSNVSHGNIKSSNILLTDFYTASVSEYGICQLVSPSYTLNQSGYRAPEVTDCLKISQKADVYSFGVLLLELLTGKAPNHGFLNEKGIDLPRWVRSMSKENQTTDVFDQELLRHRNNTEEQMVQLLRVGIHCTSRQPEKRPPMVERDSSAMELQQWTRCNGMVKSWLLNSLSRTISPSVIYCDLAHENWEELKERFSQVSSPHVFQIEQEIHYLAQDTMSVVTYFTKLKALRDELSAPCPIPSCTCGAMKDALQYQHRQRTMKFLMGLNQSYSTARGQILLMDPLPSGNRAYSLVLQMERQLEVSSNRSPTESILPTIWQPRRRILIIIHCIGHSEWVK